jgi:hypothetical protein
VPEVLTVPYRAAYTVKLAALTVAMSAVVGPIEVQFVPLMYEAITAVMYCGGLVASHICAEPLPPAARHNFAQVRLKSWGAIPATPAATAYPWSICQTTF